MNTPRLNDDLKKNLESAADKLAVAQSKLVRRLGLPPGTQIDIRPPANWKTRSR